MADSGAHLRGFVGVATPALCGKEANLPYFHQVSHCKFTIEKRNLTILSSSKASEVVQCYEFMIQLKQTTLSR